MKKIYKKEEGVSPVIATILMVAITVVLAATVWLLVSGYMGGGTQTPLTMSLTYNAQQSSNTRAVFGVTLSQPSQANPSNVKITIKNGTYTGSKTGLGTSDSPTIIEITQGSNTYGYEVYYVDLNGNSKLDTGDQIVVEPYSTSGVIGGQLSGISIYIYVNGYSGHGQATVPA